MANWVSEKPVKQKNQEIWVSETGTISNCSPKLTNEIGFDTLSSDIALLGKTVKSIYNGWQSKKTMDSTKPQVESMYNRLKALQSYNSQFGDGSVDVSEQINAYKSVLDEWDKIAESYGKYKNADEYDEALKNAEEKLKTDELLRTANTVDIETEINDLQKLKKKAEVIYKQWNVRSVGAKGDQKARVKKARDEEIRNVTGGYTFEELQKLISEKEQFKNKAKWAQNGVVLSSVSNKDSKNYDKNFKKYVSSGVESTLGEVGDLTSISGIQAVPEYTNIQIAFLAMKEHYGKTKLEGPLENTFGDRLDTYRFMKDNEFELLAYYFGKDKETGKNQAEEYLYSIEEVLAERRAVEEFKKYKDKTFKEIMYGIPSGLNQYGTGIQNLSNDNEYIPLNYRQQLSGMIREDLKDNGPAWLAGTSLAQGAFDFLNTTSNMAPSILGSAVLNAVLPGAGAVLGAATMGFSASGNAYQEKINLGWSKEDAKKYSIAVGVSEAGLSYALSGIGSLGGKLSGKTIKAISDGVEGALGKFVLTYGGKISSEVLEESLQEILNPVFENLALGYKENDFSDIEWQQVAYSAVMAALSAGLLEFKSSYNDSFKANKNASNNTKFVSSNLRLTTNAVSQPLETYNEEKQSLIKSFLDSVDVKIKNFVQRVKSGDLTFAREKISNVNERVVKDIKNLLGIDVSGYTHNINTNGIQHILTRHGENGKHDSTMSLDEDIARVGWILENYDSVEILKKDEKISYSSEFRDDKDRPAPQIKFVKKIDGYYYVVEAACENKFNKLWVQSAYLTKNKEDVTQAAFADNGQDTNAQSALASPSSNTTVPQNVPGVNTIISDSEQNNNQESANEEREAVDLGGVDTDKARHLNRAEQRLIDTPDSELTPEQRAVKQTILERQQKNITRHGDVDGGEVGFGEPTTKEIYRKSTAQEEKEALFGKRKDAKQRHILDVAKKLDSDMTVVFVDPDNKKLSGRAGVFIHNTNTMYLSNDNSVVGMYCQLFKHEFVHRLESKGAYQSFKIYLLKHSSAFENYVRAKLRAINGTEFDGTREEALNAFRDYYIGLVQNGEFTAEYKRNFTAEYAEREMVADFVGEILFKGKEKRADVAQNLADGEIDKIIKLEDTFAEFENLNETERSWFRKVIDFIKDWIASLRGIKQNERLVKDLEYIEQRLSRVLDSKDTKKAASRAVDRQYSLNENAESELHKALYDISYRNEVLLRDETPSIMLSQKNVKNRPMVMNASHIRENVFTEEEAAKLGLKVDGDKHYHGLGEKFFLKIIDGLDNVKEAYRGTKYANIPSRRENYFLLVSEFKDQDGNIINVPVYIEEGAQCNRVYLKSNKIATVFGKEDFRDYISNQLKNKNLVRIKNKSNKISEGGVPLTPAYENTALTDIILNEEDSVKNNVSSESENYSEDSGEIKQSFALEIPSKQENEDGLSSLGLPMQIARENLIKYENGELTREQYLEENERLWGEAIEKYGSIPEGEKAQAPIVTPKAVDEGKLTERFVRTIIETGKLTEEAFENIEEKVLLGDFSYKAVSDDTAMQTADTAVKNGTAEDIWENTVATGKRINKNKIAIGERLLSDAIENGDTKRIIEISSELADIFTRAGQVVQAARLLKKMTGAGRLVSAQRIVKTLNSDLIQKYGEGRMPIRISSDAAERLANAKTEKGIEHAYQEILQQIADQVPANWLDKWNALRYFFMLSNSRTHVRNLVGNAIFMPMTRIKNAIAYSAESIAVKGGKLENDKRTKQLAIKKEYADFAKNDINDKRVKDLLKGNKYNDKTIIREKQKLFKHESLNFLTELNSNLLESEDMLFKNKHYIHALASFLQSRNADLKNISEELLFEARIYAVKEAKKATFNDENIISDYIQRFGNKNALTNVLVEGLLPFKRTPINIVRRGIEYSPIGLGLAVTKGIYDVKKGRITVTEYIDGLASGITGTGVMLIGMLLANLGIIVGGMKDDDESTFEKLMGKQEYSVEILGKSYTIDWAAPSVIPFFIGTEIVNTMRSGEEFNLSDVGNIIWNSLEPITELSMLSGIQGVIESTKYADNNQMVASIIGNLLTSYAMQGIPAASGAVARTIDPVQRGWYIDKNSKWFDSFTQSVWNNVSSKIPFLTFAQIPKINAWGEEVKRGNAAERLAENFISPGYYSEVDYNEVNNELLRLGKATGEDVYPKTAAKFFSVNGETKLLTADEYVTYAKAKGQYSHDYVDELMAKKSYNKLTDEEKVKVIKNLYEYANAKAKTTVSDYDLNKQYKTVTHWERNGNSAVDYYIAKAIKD